MPANHGGKSRRGRTSNNKNSKPKTRNQKPKTKKNAALPKDSGALFDHDT
jgi:hypothetical protein